MGSVWARQINDGGFMFEAYRVAVRLQLTNGISGALATIKSDLLGTHQQIGAINTGLLAMEARLASIKRLGLVGAGMTVAGSGMLLSLKGPIAQAIEYERETAKMRQMGLGEEQIREAQKFAQANTIIGTSIQQRTRLFAEAQGAFRESGMDGSKALEAAKTMMPVLASYELAMKTLSGGKHAAAEGAMRSLNKTVEMMGGLGDAKRAAEIADGVFKAVQSSGKMVDERQLKQFIAYGGSATNQLGMRAIFGGLEPIIGEFGGSQTATGLLTAYNRVNGTMSLPPKLLLSEMQRLGMADATGRKQTKDLADLQSTDATGYAQKLMEIYAAHGITSRVDIERENAIILGRTGAKIYNKIMSQMPVLGESLNAYDKAHGIDQTNKDNAKSPMMAVEDFNGAMSDLKLVIGQTVLPEITPLIRGLTELLKTINGEPGVVKDLTVAFVAVGGALATGGPLLTGLALSRIAFGGIGDKAKVAGEAIEAASGNVSKLGGGLRALGLAVAPLLAMLAVKEWAEDQSHDKERVETLKGWSDTAKGWLPEWMGDPSKKSMARYMAARGELDGTGGDYVKGTAPRQPQAINNTIVMPDGRVLANVVTEIQAKEAERLSRSGGGRFDGRMSLPHPAQSGR